MTQITQPEEYTRNRLGFAEMSANVLFLIAADAAPAQSVQLYENDVDAIALNARCH